MAEAGSSSSRAPRRRPPKLRSPAPEEAGPSRPYMPSLCTNSKNPSTKCYGDRFIPDSTSLNILDGGDRFIPDRSAMDMDMAYYLLTEPKKDQENEGIILPAKETYRRLLAEKFLSGRTRILAFRNKPPEPEGMLQQISVETFSQTNSAKQRRKIPKFAERTLDAPGVVDDYYLNVLDWGSKNVVSIALENTLYLWNSSNSSTSELVTVDGGNGPITSVSWSCEGQHIAVGLNSSDIQLWDTSSSRMLRTLRGVHESRVGSLAWNSSILTTGGMDGKIVNNDVRMRAHMVQTYRGHAAEVCGLRWSGSCQQLASGGNDNLVHIWDASMASSNPSLGHNRWLHRFSDHLAAVKALAWCPFQSNLLASGGGGNDRCIKFWSTHTGSCLNSVDTGAQVCALLWNKNEKELLSACGFAQKPLILWKYPSMVKLAELEGHTSRVLCLAQSPDGSTVASVAADETLRFWNVFGPSEAPKPAAKTVHTGMFNNFSHIR